MNDLKVVAQVMETTDYSIFKPTVGNRNVNKLHVKRLKDSAGIRRDLRRHDRARGVVYLPETPDLG